MPVERVHRPRRKAPARENRRHPLEPTPPRRDRPSIASTRVLVVVQGGRLTNSASDTPPARTGAPADGTADPTSDQSRCVPCSNRQGSSGPTPASGKSGRRHQDQCPPVAHGFALSRWFTRFRRRRRVGSAGVAIAGNGAAENRSTIRASPGSMARQRPAAVRGAVDLARKLNRERPGGADSCGDHGYRTNDHRAAASAGAASALRSGTC